MKATNTFGRKNLNTEYREFMQDIKQNPKGSNKAVEELQVARTDECVKGGTNFHICFVKTKHAIIEEEELKLAGVAD